MNKIYIFLKNFKRTKIWRFIVEYLFYPSFHFLWSFVLNFNAKILYFLWNFRNKEFFEFGNNDKLLVSDNNYFTEIANKILQESNYLKEEAKKKLFNLNYAEEMKKHIDALPENAKKYIFAVEDFIGAKISSISTSPEREDTILIENPFDL